MSTAPKHKKPLPVVPAFTEAIAIRGPATSNIQRHGADPRLEQVDHPSALQLLPRSRQRLIDGVSRDIGVAGDERECADLPSVRVLVEVIEDVGIHCSLDA
jgi:hypothetical protein